LPCQLSTGGSLAKLTDLVQGALDLLILRLLRSSPYTVGESHNASGKSPRVLQVNQGALYPALHRLEQQGLIQTKWGGSENNRRAKFY
jgi:PadR family transcriptional regulator PadR